MLLLYFAKCCAVACLFCWKCFVVTFFFFFGNVLVLLVFLVRKVFSF
jgi:hypothetical protein